MKKYMKLMKRIGLVLLATLVVIQFFHPAKNEGTADGPNAMVLPADVKNILETSCFDCHSNHTNYPWYNNIQPVAWWLNDHVNEGKREINFSEFNTYKLKRKIKKMKEIREQIDESEMPLTSYTLIHGNAKLTEAQKTRLLAWADSTKLSLADTVGH